MEELGKGLVGTDAGEVDRRRRLGVGRVLHGMKDPAQTVPITPNDATVSFVVQRAATRLPGQPAQPTTVPFTVVDGCGAWPTFVGGGNAAGF
jgi:hypothetical protein